MDFSRRYSRTDIINDKNTLIDIVISLMILLVIGAYYYGYRAIVITILCVISSVVAELVYSYVAKKEWSYDTTIIPESMIAAFMLPVCVNLLIPVGIGVLVFFFRILCVEKIGYYFTRPALFATGVVHIIFFRHMNNYVLPFAKLELFTAESSGGIVPKGDFVSMLLGNSIGFYGTTCVAMILIFGILFSLKGIIKYKAGLSFLLTVFFLLLVTANGYTGFFLNAVMFISVYII